MNAIFKKIFSIILLYSSTSVAWEIPEHAADIWPGDKESRRVSFRHIEGEGIGYNQGYSTLEGFFAPESSSLMPFLDVRGHVFDNGKLAANVGAGLRTLAGCCVYGVNVYYDYRNAQRKSYNQVGVGLEALGTHCDFRVNGYIPAGKTITCPFNSQFAGFISNAILINQNYQFAMPGMNAEVGFYFGKSRFLNFYAAAGSYYYHQKVGSDFWGGKARFMVRLKEYATIEVSNSYDKVFRNRFQCQLTLTLPFGKELEENTHDQCDNAKVLYSRMVQPVARHEIIVEGCGSTCCPAIDPQTGNPYNVVFVNNTSHSNGTYESPYPTLALAQEHSKPGDIIYVFSGDGTTRGMNQGIVLQNNQRFWGSGNEHLLKTAQGDFVIPAQTTTAPKMTNIAGDGITVSATNEVSGFNLSDVAGNGIFGSIAQNIDLGQCIIDNATADQIHLTYAQAAGSGLFSELTISNGNQKGIFIDANNSSMIFSMDKCIIKNNGDLLNAAIDISCANRASLSIRNNTIEQNANVCKFDLSGTSDIAIIGNTIRGNTYNQAAPLQIIAHENPLSATIRNNVISDNTTGAVHVVLNQTRSATLSITKNSITNNDIGGLGSLGAPFFIDPNGSNAGTCTINYSNNTLKNNSGNALFLFNGTFSEINVNADRNVIDNNGGGGFIFASDSNALNLNATNNSITNGGDTGIATAGAITIESANINITKNQITNNGSFANAIAMSHDGTSLNLNVKGNNMSDNEGSGLLIYSADGINTLAANIANNTVNNNQNLGSNASGGIDIEQYTQLIASIENNTALNNANDGVFVQSTLTAPSACVTLVGNTSDQYTLSSGAGTFKLAPCNAAELNTGTINPVGTIDSVQSCPGGAPCS